MMRRSLTAWLLCLVISQTAAQQLTDNLIYSTVNPAPQGASYNWSGFAVTNSNGGGLSGGNVPGYNTATGTFLFGYAQGTVAYSMAINSALSGSGVQVNGINYGFQYYNQDFSRGSLSTTVSVLSNQGVTLQSYFHSLPNTTQGWTNFDQVKTFGDPYSLANLGNVTMTWTGKDDRFWAGYYGPQFRNQYLRLSYGADLCQSDPLSSPTCQGYAQAFLTQQCTANPLYDSSCPGYAQALFTQQCTANSLYNPACPGYAQAYFTQQCTANPLYDSSCPGYAQAYFTQQCTANPLSDAKCPGYAQAYFTQQCTANPLSDAKCPGYAKAYYDQQCSLNGLYDRNCPNYATAYATQQLLNAPSATSGSATATANTTTSTVSSGGAVAVPGLSDPTVAATVSSTTQSTAPSASPAAVTTAVPLTAAPAATPAAPLAPTTLSSAPASAQTSGPSAQSQPAQPPSRAQQLQQARMEAARKEVAARGGENMRQSQEAKSLDQQIELQGQIIGAMGHNPGFDVYNSLVLRDRGFYPSVQIYPNSRTVDNTRLLRGLTGASERRFDQMVDQQYQ